MIHYLENYLTYNVYGLLNMAACVITFSVGLLVYLGERTSPVHKMFFMVTITGAAWLFCYGMIGLVADERNAYFWLSVGYLTGVPFISPFVYIFTCYWAGKPPKRSILIAIFGTALVLGILGSTSTQLL